MEIETRYGRFAIDPKRDKKMADRLRTDNFEVVECLLPLIKNKIFVDVGAHIGTIAIPLSKVASKTIAFEANPQTFLFLKQNCELNHVAIDVRQQALGSVFEEMAIGEVESHNAGSQKLARGRGVSVIPLDTAVSHADVLKIDVEGMELEVLKGAVQLIERARPLVFFEANIKNPFEIWALHNFFYSRNYRFFIPLHREFAEVGLFTAAYYLSRRALFGLGKGAFDVMAAPQEKAPATGRTASALKEERRKRNFKAITFRASSIGDCLMGKYLLENIHMEYPSARCGIVIANRGEMIRDLFTDVPWLSIIEANRHAPLALWSLLKNWHGSNFVATQYTGKHGGAFGLMSKFAARVLARRGSLYGFKDASPWGFLYSHLLPVEPHQAVAEHERALLRAARIPLHVPYPALAIVPDATVPKRYGLEQYILVHPFAGNRGRSLGVEGARSLIRELQKRYPEFCLVLSGGKSDRVMAEEMAKDFSRVVVLAGDVSLHDMMQLVNFSRAVVSVDTGIAHIAAQLRHQLIVMRTCLGPNWWFPEQYGKAPVAQFSRDELCRPHLNKSFPDCINKISMADVVSALQI